MRKSNIFIIFLLIALPVAGYIGYTLALQKVQGNLCKPKLLITMEDNNGNVLEFGYANSSAVYRLYNVASMKYSSITIKIADNGEKLVIESSAPSNVNSTVIIAVNLLDDNDNILASGSIQDVIYGKRIIEIPLTWRERHSLNDVSQIYIKYTIKSPPP